MREKTIDLQFTSEEMMVLIKCVDEKRKALLTGPLPRDIDAHKKAYFALVDLITKLASPIVWSPEFAEWMFESVGISFTKLEDE